MSARIRLRRTDGKLFLERWGFECERFGVFLHHIEAPDPTPDRHDHPWNFASLVLKGGYTETRNRVAWAWDEYKMVETVRRRWSWRTLRLDTCHTITEVHDDTWTLVFRGRKRSDRKWGFFTPKGFVSASDYGARPLFEEPV